MPRDQRLYMTFPIDFWTHPKVSRLSDAAFRAFVEANGHSRMRETDGVIEQDDAEFLWKPDALAELVDSHPSRPLMVRSDSGEYVLRDYAEHQFTKADRDELSKKRADAARIGAEKRAKAKQVPASAEQVLSKTEQPAAGIGIGIGIGKEILSSSADASEETGEAKLKATRLPKDWVPTASHYELAKERRVDIHAQVEAFRLHAETHDRHAARWNAAFTTWLKKSAPGVKAPVAVTPQNEWMFR